jgi:hypothetical protein
MESHPLRYLITNIIVDPDSGTTIFRATDDVSQQVAATAQHRMFAARIWSVLAVDILRRMEAKYGAPSHDALSDFFTTDFIDEGVADRIARAFELFWDGQADESAHVLAPRLEAVLREVARQLGVPIIREPIGNKPGGVRSLGDLFHSQEGLLPTPGWQAYFLHLLRDPLGSNLRNVVGHGMRARISPEDAALLLHAACLLRLLRPPEKAPHTSSPE